MAKVLTKAYTNQRPITLPDDASAEWTAVDIEFPTVAPAASDMHMLCKIPPGYQILDWLLTTPDVDSGGGALAYSFGVALADETDLSTGTDIFLATSTFAGTGVPARNLLPNPLITTTLNDVTKERKLALKCTTIATTYAGSGKVGKLLLLLQG